ncbi:hypothetical protein L596_025079 [Steinernema carpocapsae]|uniref:Pyridoxal phosphate homeostasis protein n=1 Tax=Steinernema carpocapsae TaxID=34508 RepID=A0A4U5M6R1_STECR|nr:hypothetical protein L596_025079 [Steinernema carpocapsae]
MLALRTPQLRFCSFSVSLRNTGTMASSSDLQNNLNAILANIDEAAQQAKSQMKPILLAVSKTKPSSMIQELYDGGHRDFGENYVQELDSKAAELSGSCPEMRWHYIGTLQTNKISKLASIENLYCVQTISSIKHCDTFDKEMEKRGRMLNVMVQMNSSGEEQKGGQDEENCLDLAKHVTEKCANLNLFGFMTIGSFDRDPNEHNPDFDLLFKLREKWCQQAGKDVKNYHLSMGMSNDYVQAIKQGSTVVRVGSSIFGARIYKK